jgi:hypothetical protein
LTPFLFQVPPCPFHCTCMAQRLGHAANNRKIWGSNLSL